MLLKTVELLDKSNKEPKDKALILNAAAYFIRDKIKVTYKRTSPENSNLFNSLTTSLDLTTVNKPEQDESIEMYVALEKFFRSNVYKHSDPRKGYLDELPFSSEKIKGYTVEDDIRYLIKTLLTMKLETVDVAEEKHQKQLKEAKKSGSKSSGLLGMFGGSTSTSAAPSEAAKVELK